MAEIERKDLATVNLVKGTSADMTMLAEIGGSIVRVKAEDIVPYREDDVSYGITFDTAVSSPACTRIGNMALHKTLPVQSLMRGCLLNDDGVVTKYLNSKDWTEEDRSGASGQVMVELPQHYRKCIENGTERTVRMSLYPLPGYTLIPKMYVSAYEASLDRLDNKLCSIVNNEARYRGGNNTSSYDEGSNSLLGCPVTSTSRTNFRSYARKRKSGSTEWNCMTYDAQITLYWLFVIEYATLNSQAAYNASLTSEGYRQGGLGDGVTAINSDKWNTFNGYNPFIHCGYTDELGNRTGVKEYTMPTEYDASGVKTSAIRYRGVENPFGHIWQWTDGINVRISPNVADGGDGLSKIYVCSDPAKFSDSGYDGYTYIGDEARDGGYVKEIIFGERGDIMPKTVGGGSTTYFCDNHWTNIPTAETLRGLLFGGYATVGAYAGFVFAYSRNAPSYTGTDVGSRLCFIPETA